MTGSERRLEIARLGARGDGIADTPDGPVYVPLTLPGESVQAALTDGRGALRQVLEPSSDRVAPVCRHFGSCGGCALQHMAQTAYLDWKRDVVVRALAARGLDPRVDKVRELGPGCRRRATFAARRTKKTVVFGYHGARDSALIEIGECPVLHPEIVKAMPALKQLVAPLLSRRGEARVKVTLTAGGLDVAILNARPGVPPELNAQLAKLAGAMGLVRLVVNEDDVAVQGRPVVTFGGVDVAPPSGVFLQASIKADQAMGEIVTAAVDGARTVADLFAGVGTLTFPLAARAPVLAVDSDKAALKALEEAARHAQGIKPVTAKLRDLIGEPLAGRELAGFDAVVFDPPRAGARAQAAALAASNVPLVIAVSCNPATLARDCRILVDGGYRLTHVTPIDQFMYSPHIEAVAVLRR